MIVNLRGIKLATLLAVTLLSSAAFAEDATLTKADALIKAGDYKAAYQLLEPLEDEQSGNVKYDYLLGVAGVQSGNVTRGVFALERVLAVEPNNGAARVQIARAYYLLGENETAKTEFQNTLSQNPPEEVSSIINRYMNSIDKALGLSTAFAAYLEGTFGYDSNVNSATSSSTVAASPALGGILFTLSKNSREQSDHYLSVAGGASFRQPIAKGVSLFGSINGVQKSNYNQDIFDTSSLDGNLGLSFKKNIDTYSVAYQDSSFYVDSNSFRHARGVSGQWQRDLNQTNQISAFVQATRLSYPDNDIRDANRYVLGGGWAHVFAGDRTPVIFTSAYLGKEKARDSDFDQFSNKLYGARVGGQLSLTPKWVAYTSGGYEYRDYDESDPFFGKARRDDQYDVAVGLRFLPGHNWVIKPQLSYLKNESNISLNDFDRTVLSVSFRHDFNW